MKVLRLELDVLVPKSHLTQKAFNAICKAARENGVAIMDDTTIYCDQDLTDTYNKYYNRSSGESLTSLYVFETGRNKT